MVSRVVLSDAVSILGESSFSDEQKAALGQCAVSCLTARGSSLEEQLSGFCEMLADAHERAGEWRRASQALMAIPLHGQRSVSDDKKVCNMFVSTL